MKIDKSLLSGSTTLLILSLLQEQDQYGYQMIAALAARSEEVFQMKEGTLYPALHALENRGCVVSYEKEGPSGRQRKYYHITHKGLALLAEKEAEWRAFSKAVGQVLNAQPPALAEI